MSGKHRDHEHHDHAKASGHEPAADEQSRHDPADAEIEKLREELAAKDKELAELKDKYLRAAADFDNSRKRLRQLSEDSVRVEKENLLRDLLPIADNLERAVDAARAAGESDAIVKGVELVLNAMQDFLRVQGVIRMESVGQPFDPSRHEAIAQIPSDTHPHNSVVEEFHRGYQIGQRVLRPARVSVATGGAGRRSDGENDSDGIENT